jgi:riboflavin transporter FmnP
MNAKTIALVITFAAAAIALNVIRIPTIFYPGAYFQFGQIPVVIAFLLFGPKVGIFVGLINLVGGITLFPVGAGTFIVYPADFLSSLLMFAGIDLVRRIRNNYNKPGKTQFFKKPAVGSILGALLIRTTIMPFFDFAVVYHILVPIFFGFRPSEIDIWGLVPAFVVYNAIVSFYVVSTAYVIATKASMPLKIEMKYLT